jgi:hypothetical protein
LNKNILNTGIQDFIKNNLTTDTLSVALSKPLFNGVDNSEIIQQIEAAKKCVYKLPTWFNTQGIFYPLPLQIEQTSSEVTAGYKAGLVSGESLADVSGGTGIDSFYFAKNIAQVYHLEINTELAEIAAFNFNVLGVQNIRSMCLDGIDFIRNLNESLDWIYVDPSRRSDQKGKVFMLEDCSPSMPAVLPILWEKTHKILVKTAPLLDISAGLRELSCVKEVHAVAVNKEVKELLWLLEKNYQGPVALKAAMLNENGVLESFNSSIPEETQSKASFSLPQEYLFEPHAAVLKLGAFKSVSSQLGVFKLHPNSHLYTGHNSLPFPGRSFKIVDSFAYHKKAMKSFDKTKANVSTRNFKMTVAALRKKHHLRDGGSVYLFFTTDLEERPIVIVCEKI